MLFKSGCKDINKCELLQVNVELIANQWFIESMLLPTFKIGNWRIKLYLCTQL